MLFNNILFHFLIFIKFGDRFINERIELLVLSKTDKGTARTEADSHTKPNGSVKVSSDHFSRFLDPSAKGVELVELKKDQAKASGEKHEADKMNGIITSKDPLLSMDTQSTRSWSSLPSEKNSGDGRVIHRHQSGEEWGDKLDVFSRRKTEALAPEHFDNMWAKGRNYKRKGVADQSNDPLVQGSLVGTLKSVNHSKEFPKQKDDGQIKGSTINKQSAANKSSLHSEWNNRIHSSISSSREEDKHRIVQSDEVESGSNSSYTTEDEEPNNITGLDTPGIRVWDGKNKNNVTTIHHPLESFEGHKARKEHKGHNHPHSLTRIRSGRKRSRSTQKGHVWQEVQRTSFLGGDGKDILNSSTGKVKDEDSSDDSGAEMFSSTSTGSTTSSFLSSTSLPGTYNLAPISSKSSVIADSFLTLRCEVFISVFSLFSSFSSFLLHCA